MKARSQIPYLRIGTSYYKIVDVPSFRGIQQGKLIPWTLDAIKHDETKETISKIPKYDGFITFPEHINYRQTIGTFYNQYFEISHRPNNKGDCKLTLDFIRHIFGDQYELGLDYLTLLYIRTTEKLPILLLVSRQRNTGKTTWLNFLKAIFQNNMTLNDNDSFRSQFNSDWASALIVGVDEVLLQRIEDSERIKALSTAAVYKSEAKNQNRHEVDFFVKFVLCSNDDLRPIIILPEETRYWVRNVKPFTSENEYLMDQLIKEIPAFLNFINNRQLSVQKKLGRMWFDPSMYRTAALERIMNANRSRLEVEVLLYMKEIMETAGVEELHFTPNDVINMMMKSGLKPDRAAVIRLLKESWALTPKGNSLSYLTYAFNSDGIIGQIKLTGRYYSIGYEELQSKL
ncbi:primase-helicase family protein [Dyadobacter koreensis]|nr:primase-helicase family protein [Dyadobacter koreensis]